MAYEMTQERINALGFVEVRGLAAAIETADAMLKCADVRLLRQLLRDPVHHTPGHDRARPRHPRRLDSPTDRASTPRRRLSPPPHFLIS